MEVVDLAWDDEAWDSFTAQAAADPARYAVLHGVLTLLATEPGDASLRRRRYQDPPLFAVTVSAGSEDWQVLWNLADDGVPQVWYVGPAPI
ncbi:MAG: hypothetical protein ACYCTI_04705 [Acidimicrobiales bacterium]